MRRAVALLIAAASSVLTLAALAVLLMAVALGRGPVPLTLVEPYVARAVERVLPELRFHLTEPSLRRSQESGTLELAVGRLEISTPDGVPLFASERAALAFDSGAWLTAGEIRIDSLVLREPELELVRPVGGGYVLRLRGATIATGQASGARPLAATADLLEDLLTREYESGLARFRATGAKITLIDEASGTRLVADDGTLVLDTTTDQPELRVDVRLGAGAAVGTPGRLRGTIRRVADTLAIEAELRGVVPAWLVPFASLPHAAELTFPVAAEVTGSLSLEGEPGPVTLHLLVEGQRAALPGLLAGPVPLDRLEALASLDPASGLLTLERFQLASGAARVEAVGTVLVTPESALVPEVTAKLRDVDAPTLLAWWPVNRGPHARDWVETNVERGRIVEGEVRLHAPGPNAPPERRVAVAGRFAFEHATVHYYHPMPPAEAAGGEARFDLDQITFAVRTGKAAGLDVKSAEIRLGQWERPGRRLAAQGEAAGPVPAFVALVRQLPAGIGERVPMTPEQTGGKATARLDLAVPLEGERRAEALQVHVTAKVGDGALKELAGLPPLTHGELELRIDRRSLEASGTARVAEQPIEILALETFFVPETPNRWTTRVKSRLSPADLARFDIAPPAGVKGSIEVTVSAAAPRKGAPQGEVEADLAALALDLPRLLLTKPAGAAGRLHFAFARPDEGRLVVEKVNAAMPGLTVRGRAELSGPPWWPTKVELSHLAWAGSVGKVDLTLTPERVRGRIDAERVDIRPWLDRRGGSESGKMPKLPAIGLTVNADTLVLPGAALRGIGGAIERSERGWRDVALEGRLPSGVPVRLTLTPDDAGPAVRLVTDDAGGLLSALDADTRYAAGGTFRLEARILAETPGLVAEGQLNLRDYTLEQAPVLARLLTVASLTGIANLLQGKGIRFDRARIQFRLEPDVLKLDNGRAVGSQLGITLQGEIARPENRLKLDGTVVPAYTINRILGAVPIVGWLLRGEEGVGAFAVTYSVRGTRSDPEITVNPLSLLVPGFIRDLFGDLVESGAEPAPEAKR